MADIVIPSIRSHFMNCHYMILLFIFRGLGIERIVLNVLKVHCDPGNLVLVIGASQKEEVRFVI